MKRKLICAVLIFFNIFSIIGSTVCLAESPSGIRAAYKSVIDQAYSDYVNSDNSIDTWTYSLYDVNKDGTPELIINDEKSKNIRSVNVYNFDNGKVNYIGSFQPALGELCAYPDGSGIAVLHQLKNHEFIDLYTFNNTLDYAGNLTDSFLVNSDVDYRRPEEIYPGAYTLPKCTVDNYDLLNSVFPNDSFDNKAVNSDGMNDVFSIISGTWENDKGEEVTLRSDGMTDEDAEINCTTTEVVNNSDGSYSWGITTEHGDGYTINLYPEGVNVLSWDGKLINTDTSKPRIWMGNGTVDERYSFYYKEITVLLNGEKIEFDQPPIMSEGNRVMVPIRAVAEKMGDDVKWSNHLNSALIVHADRMVVFRNNNENVLIYGDPTDNSTWSNYTCDVPPQEINGRTLTPIRAIGECLGAKVDWYNDSQTVAIEYNNTPHTLKENAVTQLNAYWSSALASSDFSSYSDEINEFCDSRDNWADAFIIFWDDWTISLDILASREPTNVYMLKNCFAEILSDIPDSNVKDFEIYGKILEWLSKTSKLADIDFTKVNETVKISAQTANSLSKFGNAVDKAGTVIDFSKIGIDVLAELLSDYSTGMLYIDTLRSSLNSNGIKDSVVYSALDELENDYTNKCVNALIQGAADLGGSTLLRLISGGAFNVSEFCKEIANWSVGNDDKAEAVRNINCIYLFNDYIDTVYDDVRHSLIGDPTRIDDYTILYNLEKATKIKMYEAMDQLREKSDQYTKNRIAEQLESLRSASYILWE